MSVSYNKYVAAILLFTYHLGTSLMVNNECGDAGKKQRSSTIFDLECVFYILKSQNDFERHQVTRSFQKGKEIDTDHKNI